MADGRRLFGTDGIRGTANREPITVETMIRVGLALGHWTRLASHRSRVVIGRDTRRSGDMVEGALTAGLCAAGADVLLAGPLPTPGVALLTRMLVAVAGAVVSASHNPAADNGVKLFGGDGFKLSDAAEAEIEATMSAPGGTLALPTGTGVGTATRVEDAASRYVDAVVATVPPSAALRGVRVVLDCAHGATYRVAPEVFRALGAHVVTIGVDPDGDNINRDAGALHPDPLQARVVAEHAQIGMAFDGDGDRVVLVDETGTVADGDEILAILALDRLAGGALPSATVVATVMSNLGLEVALQDRGARLLRTQVGDRYVVEAMRQGGYSVGGEQSGHIILLDHSTTGDGVVAGLQVLRLMVERGQPLSELRRQMTRFPQTLVNVRVARRGDPREMPGVQETIDRISQALGARGRVLVRTSGTEPLVRVMVEGEDADRVRTFAEEIAAMIGAGASA